MSDGISYEKLKTNMGEAAGALKKVGVLKTHLFEYRQDGVFERMYLPKGKRYGFLAQEVIAVLERSVAALVDAMQETGQYTTSWSGQYADGVPVPAGIFFCRLRGVNRSVADACSSAIRRGEAITATTLLPFTSYETHFPGCPACDMLL